MPRRDTPLVPGHYYHLYNRGNNHQPIFYGHDNYLFFLERLRDYLTPILDVAAYCLMPNHYHLLVLLKEPDLSHRMQLLAISYTKAINRQEGRVGSLFQGAFRARLVDEDEYLIHLSRYLHLNPVHAGLAAEPEEWEYSSYRDYVGRRDGSLPRPEIVLSQFPSVTAYRQFVRSYVSGDRGLIEDLLF